MSYRRKNIIQKYQKVIDDIYANHAGYALNHPKTGNVQEPL
jgi:hypothetical protein